MSNEDVENIHLRLRAELERLGLSLAAASRAAGESSPQRLKDVMSGKQKCPVDLIARLAIAGVDLIYVLTGERASVPPQNSACLSEAFEIAKDLPDDAQEEILQRVKEKQRTVAREQALRDQIERMELLLAQRIA